MRARRTENAVGPFWVDEGCIDCDACRQLAPDVFADVDGMSAVVAQPAPGRVAEAMRAVLACPVAAIHVDGARPPTEGLLPQRLDGPVWYLGYNAESSFGANAFLVERADGNLMIDSPRWVPRLARAIELRGGLAHVLLSHRDDIADAERYAHRFGARVWIHAADRRAAAFATNVFDSDADIAPGVRALFTPGHTRGSAMFLVDDRWLFTGDSLCWDRTRGRLHAFRDACWYDFSAQRRSLARLRDERFRFVLAGHGDRMELPEAEMQSQLEALLVRME